MSHLGIYIIVVCFVIGLAPLWWKIDGWFFRRKMRKDGWKDEWGWPGQF